MGSFQHFYECKWLPSLKRVSSAQMTISKCFYLLRNQFNKMRRKPRLEPSAVADESISLLQRSPWIARIKNEEKYKLYPCFTCIATWNSSGRRKRCSGIANVWPLAASLELRYKVLIGANGNPVFILRKRRWSRWRLVHEWSRKAKKYLFKALITRK